MATITASLYLCTVVSGQESTCLQQYRTKVKEYNQDIKVAGYAMSASKEDEKFAKAAYLPSVSAGADISYAGNPTSLSLNVPSIGETLHFEGSNERYGATLSIAQPVYAGGAIKAGYDKAKAEKEIARHDAERITGDIIYEADVLYWKKVAAEEMAGVAKEFVSSVSELTEVVRDRIEEGYSDRNDLLMAEVKLNDAEYKYTQARSNAEVARMAMNSFAGEPFSVEIVTDTLVIPVTSAQDIPENAESVMQDRPEYKISMRRTEEEKMNSMIANSRYLPSLSVGVEGSYASPGYDLHAGPDPNYAVFAKLNVPIFEWGKGRSTRKAGEYRESMAMQRHSKLSDDIMLEIETASYTYMQAVNKVSLTGSSLECAEESEKLAMDKYREGSISIVEVINSQIYLQEAKINYIQSKLDAQIAKSAMERAVAKHCGI